MGTNLDRHRRWALGTLAGLTVLIMGGWAWSRMPPPQIGTDEDVFTTVDALFTAITSRDAKRLADCEVRLKEFRTAGKLPDRPGRFLDGIIQQARRGEWEPAARRLYDFMYGQQRQ